MKQLIFSTVGVIILVVGLSTVAFSKEPINLLRLTISTPQNNYSLGDWIEINFNLQNTGQSDLSLVKPIIDVHSVSLDITYKNQPPANPVSFVHTVLTPWLRKASGSEHRAHEDLLHRPSHGRGS